MSEVYFTSDTHFGHTNIMKLCQRPFETVEQQDEALVENWNAVVRPQDRVYHLGDFAYRSSKGHAEKIFRRLNGSKFLIIGNHDNAEVKGLKWGGEPSLLTEVSLEGTRFVLSHYPMLEWAGFYGGSVHLFGHVHGRVKGLGRSMDVGVDLHEFRPLHVTEVLSIVRGKPGYDPTTVYDKLFPAEQPA